MKDIADIIAKVKLIDNSKTQEEFDKERIESNRQIKASHKWVSNFVRNGLRLDPESFEPIENISFDFTHPVLDIRLNDAAPSEEELNETYRKIGKEISDAYFASRFTK